MKTLLLFLLFTASCSLAQTANFNKKQVYDMFKNIQKTDQSNINNPEKRQLIFEENFNAITTYISQNGFFSVDAVYKKKRHRKTIESALQTTFIHILQARPQLMLNDQIIALLELEIKKGTFKKEYLITPLKVFAYEFSESDKHLEGTFKEACLRWGVTVDLILE